MKTDYKFIGLVLVLFNVAFSGVFWISASESAGPPTYIPSEPSRTDNGWGPAESNEENAEQTESNSEMSHQQTDNEKDDVIVPPENQNTGQSTFDAQDLPNDAVDNQAGVSESNLDESNQIVQNEQDMSEDEDNDSNTEDEHISSRVALMVSDSHNDSGRVQAQLYIEDEAARAWRLIASDTNTSGSVVVTIDDQIGEKMKKILNSQGVLVCKTRQGEQTATVSVELAPSNSDGVLSSTTICWSMVMPIN